MLIGEVAPARWAESGFEFDVPGRGHSLCYRASATFHLNECK